MVYLSYKDGEGPRKEGKKMTQTANHMVKVATDVYYSANGKVRVAKIDRVWIVGKQNDGDRFFAAMAGFSTVREALVFAEGVEA
jgi:hypothetical protein